jgi:protein tyrosine/serine phosphatase
MTQEAIPNDSPEPTPASTTTPVPPDIQRRRKRRRQRWLSALILVLMLFIFLCYIGVFGGNVRAVEAGKVYRSSQLTGRGYESLSAALIGNSFDSVLDSHHIKTVLNLRGGSTKDLYYRDEVRVCQEHKVAHVDAPFSARHLPSPESLGKILDAFDHSDYPILIHCQAGSDRTGLASVLYAHLYANKPLNQALSEELTWRYGHFRVSNTRKMDEFFELYAQKSHGLGMREWIKSDYPALYAEREPEEAKAQRLKAHKAP